MLLLACCCVGLGNELPGHAHDPLPVDSSLTLSKTIDLAVAAYPGSLQLAPRVAEADAWMARSGSWLSGRPSLMLRYQSDRAGSNVGLEEYEAGVQLPLWGSGGRSAVRGFGEALHTESMAATTALRWEVSGATREALWNIALAKSDLELAQLARTMTERLTNLVERRYELGDVALSDALLARSSLLDSQTALIEVNAALLDAERAYRSVTGLGRRPEFVAERLSNIDTISAQHPVLVMANAALARAEADVIVADATVKTGANVLIGTRRERMDAATDLDDSIGVVVNIPFGGESHRRTEVTAAARRAAVARSQRNQIMRDLTLALHEAAHGLNVVHQNIDAAIERRDLVERQEAMGELAYEKGEIELIDLLKLQANLVAARRQVSRLTIAENRQTAFYNQAVGDLP